MQPTRGGAGDDDDEADRRARGRRGSWSPGPHRRLRRGPHRRGTRVQCVRWQQPRRPAPALRDRLPGDGRLVLAAQPVPGVGCAWGHSVDPRPRGRTHRAPARAVPRERGADLRAQAGSDRLPLPLAGVALSPVRGGEGSRTSQRIRLGPAPPAHRPIREPADPTRRLVVLSTGPPATRRGEGQHLPAPVRFLLRPPAHAVGRRRRPGRSREPLTRPDRDDRDRDRLDAVPSARVHLGRASGARWFGPGREAGAARRTPSFRVPGRLLLLAGDADPPLLPGRPEAECLPERGYQDARRRAPRHRDRRDLARFDLA